MWRVASAPKPVEIPYAGVGSSDRTESDLEHEIVAQVHNRTERFRLLVVDDEALYRNAVLALVQRSENLSAHIEFLSAKNAEEASHLCRERAR